MRIAFLVFVGYASLGLLYAPGIESLVAWTFITVSCAPLLLAGGDGRASQGVKFGPPNPVLFLGIVALGVLNVTLVAKSVGQPVTDLLSIEGIVRVASLATTRRYELQGASGNPILLALSLWLVFRIGAATGGIRKTTQVAALLPLIAYSAISTEKWPLFLTGVFFFAGIFLAFPSKKSIWTALRYLAVAAPVVVLFSGLAMILRGFAGALPSLAGGLLHYILAPYPALGSWLIQASGSACCALGGLSFIGPLDAFGLVSRGAGVFEKSVLVHGVETNIFTAFRYLAQDFSLVGPFLISIGVAVVHIGLRTMGSTAWSRQLAGFMIFCSLLSVNVTPFVHNSTALGVFLCLGSMLMCAARSPSRRIDYGSEHPLSIE